MPGVYSCVFRPPRDGIEGTGSIQECAASTSSEEVSAACTPATSDCDSNPESSGRPMSNNGRPSTPPNYEACLFRTHSAPCKIAAEQVAKRKKRPVPPALVPPHPEGHKVHNPYGLPDLEGEEEEDPAAPTSDKLDMLMGEVGPEDPCPCDDGGSSQPPGSSSGSSDGGGSNPSGTPIMGLPSGPWPQQVQMMQAPMYPMPLTPPTTPTSPYGVMQVGNFCVPQPFMWLPQSHCGNNTPTPTQQGSGSSSASSSAPPSSPGSAPVNPKSPKRTYGVEFMWSLRNSGGGSNPALLDDFCTRFHDHNDGTCPGGHPNPNAPGVATPAGSGSQTGMKGRDRPPALVPTRGSMMGMSSNPCTPSSTTPLTLEKGANAFGSKRGQEGETEKTVRKLKGLLNKLTAEKYHRLKEGFFAKEFDYSDQDMVEKFVSEIFGCAIHQSIYIQPYAAICSEIRAHLEKLKASQGETAEGAKEVVDFRRVLLIKCQQEFQNEDRWKSPEDEEQAMLLRKQQCNLIDFVGELYKARMLTRKVMMEIIKGLLLEKEDPPLAKIELACTLLTSAGWHLDEDNEDTRSRFATLFDRLEALSKDDSLPKRIQFMCDDIVQLRRRAWRTAQKEPPSKQKQVVPSPSHVPLPPSAPSTPLTPSTPASRASSFGSMLKGCCPAPQPPPTAPPKDVPSLVAFLQATKELPPVQKERAHNSEHYEVLERATTSVTPKGSVAALRSALKKGGLERGMYDVHLELFLLLQDYLPGTEGKPPKEEEYAKFSAKHLPALQALVANPDITEVVSKKICSAVAVHILIQTPWRHSTGKDLFGRFNEWVKCMAPLLTLSWDALSEATPTEAVVQRQAAMIHILQRVCFNLKFPNQLFSCILQAFYSEVFCDERPVLTWKEKVEKDTSVLGGERALEDAQGLLKMLM